MAKLLFTLLVLCVSAGFSMAATYNFLATLKGVNQKLAGTTGDKGGTGNAHIAAIGKGVDYKLKYTIFVRGLSSLPPIGQAVHRGNSKKQGAVLLNLPGTWKVSGATATLNGTLEHVSAGTVAAIAKQRNAFYLLVSTRAYPKGAIRGQL